MNVKTLVSLRFHLPSGEMWGLWPGRHLKASAFLVVEDGFIETLD